MARVPHLFAILQRVRVFSTQQQHHLLLLGTAHHAPADIVAAGLSRKPFPKATPIREATEPFLQDGLFTSHSPLATVLLTPLFPFLFFANLHFFLSLAHDMSGELASEMSARGEGQAG